jgi:hypothetical protein
MLFALEVYMTDRVRKKQQALAELNAAEARWMRRLFRAATALKDIHNKKKRLLKPRKLDEHELKTDEYHKIMDPQFFDDSKVLSSL